jgi:hypothetical protein
MDFRDQHIKKALDETVGPYRQEPSLRLRVRRIVLIAAFAIAAALAFASILHHFSPRVPPPPPDRTPVSIDLLPAPAKR